MIDEERTLREELDRLLVIDPRLDWDEVASRAGLKRAGRRRLWTVAATAAAAAALMTAGMATPLGSAIAHGLNDFSTWLTGEPGSPVSAQEQRDFESANARSWIGFPKGTKLRRLITQETGALTVDLLGFRSGASSLCLRLAVSGTTRARNLSCAPVDELRREGGPARVVIVDYSVGTGDKTAWYGLDRIHSAELQITAGIVTDDVTHIVVEDEAGRHEVATASNAFLYVAEQPDVGQRVRQIWARTADGLVAVPFAPAPFGYGGTTVRRDGPPAPAVEREVSGGRIGWLEAGEPRGEPLDVLPAATRRALVPHGEPVPQTVLHGRVLTPDPDRPVRLVVTLRAHRAGGAPAGLCTSLVTSGGGSSNGCMTYPDIFEHTLMPTSLTMAGGSDAFVTVSGIASDDVARLEALLADGQRAAVPLTDNVFLVELPRAKLPARLVAYDSEDRIIRVDEPLPGFGRGPAPAKGRAESLLRASGPHGETAELLVGPATSGGECMYVKHFFDVRQAGVGIHCMERVWTGDALQLSSLSRPPVFVAGRVRQDVATVRVRFADGSTAKVTPTRGYVLWAASAEQLAPGHEAVTAEGLDERGGVIGEVNLSPRGTSQSRGKH